MIDCQENIQTGSCNKTYEPHKKDINGICDLFANSLSISNIEDI